MLLAFFAGTVQDTPAISADDAVSLAGQGNVALQQARAIGQTGSTSLLRNSARQGVRERDKLLIERSLAAARTQHNPEFEAELLLELARYHFYRGEHQPAQEALELARQRYQQTGNQLGLATVCIRQSDIALRQIDLPAVEQLIANAKPVFEQQRNQEGLGDVARQTAYVAYLRGELATAEKYAATAAAYYTAAAQPGGRAQARHIQALVAMQSGNYSIARKLYHLALDDATAWGEPLFIGRELWGLGYLESREGRYETALATFLKAREHYQKISYPNGLGSIALMEAEVYLATGAYDRARRTYQEAYRNFAVVNGRMGMADATLRLGQLEAINKHWDAALNQLQQAVETFRTIEHPLGQANAGRLIAQVYLEQRRFSEAEKQLAICSRLYAKIADQWGIADTELLTGDLLEQTGRTAQAQQSYQQALSHYNQLQDSASQAKTLSRLAALASQKGDLITARRLFRQSIAGLESVRRRVGVADLKRTFMENSYQTYEQAALFLLRHQFIDDAFMAVEGMRARLFLDQLAEGTVPLEKGIDPQLKMERDRLEQHWSNLMDQMRNLAGAADRTKQEQIREELQQTHDRLERIRQDIRLKNPLYASIQYPEPVSLQHLQTAILHKKELLAEYVIAGDELYLFIISQTTARLIQLPVRRADLEAKITALVRYSGTAELAGRRFQKARDLATELYTLLLHPVAQEAADGSLLIAPDGVLALLPFELLENPATGSYAVEELNIHYLPSATVLATNRTLRRPPPTNFSFIGFGDPVYDYAGFLAGQEQTTSTRNGIIPQSFLRSGGSLTRLKGSGREVTEIGKLLQEHHIPARIELRLAAREEKAKGEQLAPFTYIHFSAHGILDNRFQAIALSQVPDTQEDGFLTLGEIMNSRYNARLVVLSACQTGLGTMTRGEGVTGLTRAVMYAGSSAAVVSLWSVADEPTRLFMVNFYAGLLAGDPPGTALMEAKRRLVTSPDPLLSHPFSWASFVIYGE